MIAFLVLYFIPFVPVQHPVSSSLKNFYAVIVFPSSDFALVLEVESFKGSSFPEFCNLSMLLENTKLNSTFFTKRY